MSKWYFFRSSIWNRDPFCILDVVSSISYWLLLSLCCMDPLAMARKVRQVGSDRHREGAPCSLYLYAEGEACICWMGRLPCLYITWTFCEWIIRFSSGEVRPFLSLLSPDIQQASCLTPFLAHFMCPFSPCRFWQNSGATPMGPSWKALPQTSAH